MFSELVKAGVKEVSSSGPGGSSTGGPALIYMKDFLTGQIWGFTNAELQEYMAKSQQLLASQRVSQQGMMFQQQHMPIQNQRMPVQNQRIPIQNQRIPVQNQRIPIQNQRIPVQNQHMPQQRMPPPPQRIQQLPNNPNNAHIHPSRMNRVAQPKFPLKQGITSQSPGPRKQSRFNPY